MIGFMADQTGLKCMLMGYNRCPWVKMGLDGLHWVKNDDNGLRRVLLG